MNKTDELALVVELACLTNDRTPAEHRALVAVAKRVDRAKNVQQRWNRYLDGTRLVGCDYSSGHEKSCVCRGDRTVFAPLSGAWSRLAELAESTKED